MATRGFFGRRQAPEVEARLPPGQYLEKGFPVLSAGPTPIVKPADWKFTLKVGPKPVKSWTWDEFNALPRTKVHKDIHCVTKWTKFDTNWEGVSVDDILHGAGLEGPPTPWVLAHSFDGYSTNVPYRDLAEGKSAKWVNGLQFTDHDEPGFWELRGYHIYGDPWKEQRFTGDP
jgi:DMSO/TMAO reductase YedYZ molybdopterin-dependent catalytic subunit